MLRIANFSYMIRFENVTKQYPTGNTALDDVTFTIDRGEFVFVVGPSGSGKTTLFRLLIRDAVPSTGSIFIGDWDLVNLPKNKIHELRKKSALFSRFKASSGQNNL